MRAVIQWAVRNSPAMNTLMVALLVVGAISMGLMRRELFPEFEMEIILVTVPYPGASPEEVEEGICRKIEEAVRSTAGIKKLTSVAKEGAGSVILELESSVKDVQKVLNEVRSQVDRIPSFPELAEDPDIKQITMRQPAVRVAIVGPENNSPTAELKLREVAERVRDELLQLPSLSQAELMGAKNYQIDIEIPEATLREYGLTLQKVAEIVRRENVEMPGGNLKTQSQEVLLRGKNKHLVGTAIASLPLVTRPNGVVLTVGDLGVVRDEFTDTTSISRVDRKPGLVISIDRTASEDILAIVDDVKEYVAAEANRLPAGYEMFTWSDRSIEVRDRLELLGRNGLQGLLLVFLVLTVFLELRLAFWVALGIPISIFGACGLLLYAGHTLNMLSTFAFLMALGIVVDDAIVVGENIYEHRQKRKGFVRAAIDGTVEVLPSVVASVSTTVIAFLPLMYVSGMMGKFIAVLPVAVIAMLIISLLESLLILPCHLAHGQDPDAGVRPTLIARVQHFRRNAGPLVRWVFAVPLLAVLVVVHHLSYPFRRLGDVAQWISRHSHRVLRFVISRIYLPSLRWSLDNPAVVISSAVALLFLSVGLYKADIVPWSLMPKMDSEQVEASIIFPDGTPAGVTDEATRRMEEAIIAINERYRAQGLPVLQHVHRLVGSLSSDNGPGGASRDGGASGSHLGTVRAELYGVEERSIPSFRIVAEWREAAGEFPGAESVVFGGRNMGPGGKQIEFKLLADGTDIADLERAIEETKSRLREYPGVFDVSDDSAPGKWEYQIKIKEKAMSMGVPVAELAETVRASYYGAEVMRLQRGRHEVKLMVRYPREERRSLANFDDIRVRTGDGSGRPLTTLADVTVKRGNSEINRVNQLRSITITADVEESKGNASEVVADLRANFIAGLFDKYPGVTVRWEGQQEQTVESMTSLFRGLGIALFAMFVLLTLEFRSYAQPLLILSIIPFGIIGAIGGHALLGKSLTLFSIFGLVALTGVVVNDSIVLIDFINHRIRDGFPVREALLDAGQRRFRPVLLTSMTTVAALLPILLETSIQAQIVIPMATSLSFGLMFATFLVLFLVPTFYSVYAGAMNFFNPPAEPLPSAREVVRSIEDPLEPEFADEEVELSAS